MLASQNPSEGRSPPRSTASTEVAIGSSPTITAPCAAGMVRIARVMSQGNPTTTPTVTAASLGSCARVGKGARRQRRTIAASAAATTARPSPMKVASSSRTATRVATSVPLKPSIPSHPNSSPRRVSTRALP